MLHLNPFHNNDRVHDFALIYDSIKTYHPISEVTRYTGAYLHRSRERNERNLHRLDKSRDRNCTPVTLWAVVDVFREKSQKRPI